MLTFRGRQGLPFHPSRIHFDGHQTQSVSKDLVLDDRCVVVDVDVLDCYCWNLEKDRQLRIEA